MLRAKCSSCDKYYWSWSEQYRNGCFTSWLFRETDKNFSEILFSGYSPFFLCPHCNYIQGKLHDKFWQFRSHQMTEIGYNTYRQNPLQINIVHPVKGPMSQRDVIEAYLKGMPTNWRYLAYTSFSDDIWPESPLKINNRFILKSFSIFGLVENCDGILTYEMACDFILNKLDSFERFWKHNPRVGKKLLFLKWPGDIYHWISRLQKDKYAHGYGYLDW